MKTRTRHLFLGLALLFLSLPLRAAKVSGHVSDLAKLPPETLIELADQALNRHGRADSALYYSLLLATKYVHKDHLSAQEKYYTSMGYNRCGYLYMFYMCDYANAVDCLIEAEKYCEDDDVRITLSQNMGHLYSLYAVCFPSTRNIVSARNYYRKAFERAFERKDWRNVVSSFINFWNFGLTPDNLHSYAKEVNRFARAPIPQSTPYYIYARAMLDAALKLRTNDHRQAADILKKMMREARTQRDDRLECYACWHIASVCLAGGETDSALHYSLRLEQMGRRMGLKDVETDADKLLAQIYQQRGGDKAAADRWQLTYFRNRDSLLVTNNLNIVKNNHLLSSVHNLTRQVGDLEQKRRAQNQLSLVIAIAVVVTLGFLAMLYNKNRQLKKQNLLLYRKTQLLIEYEKPKYQNSSLDEASKNSLKAAIEQVMVNTDEICSEDFSLERLAQLCHTGKRELSQVINEKFGQSFVLLLSEYRVHEACRRINDVEHSKQLTLEAIGMSVGFKARESFSRAFKRVTGLSPSDYQKIANQSAT